VLGERFTIQSVRSVSVISELRERVLRCEGDTSVGRTREESVMCADVRDESSRLVVEGTIDASIETL
jgi:hypothetical protein